jgi:uncharacterized protein YdeI (YjbR/CyaY-like superfamily)
MPTFFDSLEHVEPGSRAAWRAWLVAHHTTSKGCWLVYYKKSTGVPSVVYDEAVEEGLCFGWIDSKPNKLDARRSKLLFTPRKPGSPWSKPNKMRLERLVAAGLMAPAGLAVLEKAKQDGSWTLLDAIEELIYPPDFAQALAENPVADANFRAFAPSAIKGILWQIEQAKRPETRLARIEKVVALAAENIKAFQYTPKDRW